MAIKSTIYKANIAIADVDRHYYADHAQTLARHPSETEERLMIRLLAFILFAPMVDHEKSRLVFGRGLSEENEPDLWVDDDTGNRLLAIEVGLPSERVLRRSAGRANQVVLLTYGGRVVDIWRQKEGAALAKIDKLSILNIVPEHSTALAALARRNMQWQCTLQDNELLICDEHTSINITWQTLQRASALPSQILLRD